LVVRVRLFARSTTLPPRRPLLDAWVLAEVEATFALGDWREASRAGKGDAYAAYVAALDREARAAERLSGRHRLGIPRPAVHRPGGIRERLALRVPRLSRGTDTAGRMERLRLRWRGKAPA
jgi:hypothetical protein